MKLKLLLAFVALSMISCSDDDAGNPHETEKRLTKVTALNYRGDGLVIKHENFYSDNRPTTYLTYDEYGQPFVEYQYTYNEHNLLAKTEIFDLSMGSGDPLKVEVYTYDNMNRIGNVTATGDFDAYQMNYTYNSDNTITCLYTDSDSDYKMEYVSYLDSENRIYKQTVNGELWQEMIYDGENVVSWSRFGTALQTTQFSHYADLEVKGPFLKSFNSQFGNNANTIMLGGLGSYIMGVDKYMTGTTGFDVTEWVYEFDQNDYPVKTACYRDGSSEPEWVYEIEYEEEH